MKGYTNLFIAAVVLGLFAFMAIKLGQANHQLSQANEAIDSIRSEELLARARAAGWEVRVGEVTEELTTLLSAIPDTSALATRNRELAQDVQLLGGRIRELSEMYATAVGALEATATEHTTEQRDSVTAEVDDGLLSGRLFYRFATNVLGIASYQISLPITTSIVELPNGQWAAMANSTHPNVDIGIHSTLVDPPEPIRVCSIMQKAPAFGYGAAVGGLAAILFN